MLAFCLPTAVLSDDTDLGVSLQSEETTPPDINSSFTIVIQPTNFGPATSGSTDVILTISSSPSTEVISGASSSGYTCSGIGTTSVTCTQAAGIAVSSEASSGATITYTVSTGNVVGTANISYSISHVDNDTVGGNDSDSVSIEIEDASALDFCYASADSGNVVVRYKGDGSGAPAELANVLGRSDVEAISFGPDPAGPELFAYDNNELGTVDFEDGSSTEGVFTSIGVTNQSLRVDDDQDGSQDSTESPNDIDSAAFHPLTNQLWIVDRESGGDWDYLFLVDYTTGDAVPGMFGGGNVDAVRINPSICSAAPDDVDDLAISPDGTKWYVQIDSNGNNQQIGLLTLDASGIPTGALDSCYPVIDVCGDVVEDMEGTGFDLYGLLVGTTGGGSNNGGGSQPACTGSNDDHAWSIETTPRVVSGTTGYVATRVEDLSSTGGDFEGNDCSTASRNSINRITGTVWHDVNNDGLFNPATESLDDNVTVQLYLDNDDDGTISAGDLLLQTEDLTSGDGSYEFAVSAGGDFVLQIIPPAGNGLTTDNIEVANFSGTGNTDSNNNFGYATTADIEIVKTSNPDPAVSGQPLAYTLTVTNNGPVSATGVTVSDPVQTGVTWESTTPSQGNCSSPSGVTCELGTIANGNSATVTINVTVN